MEHKAFWRVWGKYYGYPQCCIDEMLHFPHTKQGKSFGYGRYITNTSGPRKFDGSGFIPCKSCNKKKLHQLEREVNNNRICSSKFPSNRQFERDLQEVLASDKISQVEKKLISYEYRDMI